MTISQNSIKQSLEKDSNFNQTIKIFETNHPGGMTKSSNNATLRKSLIPTIVNQKNYYSKFPFEKIIETTQQQNNTNNNTIKVPKKSNLTEISALSKNNRLSLHRNTTKNIEIKNSADESSNASSNILIVKNTNQSSISSDGDKFESPPPPAVLHRNQQHNLMMMLQSPPIATPRSSITTQQPFHPRYI